MSIALKLATEALANPLIKKGKFDGSVQEVDSNVVDLASAFAQKEINFISPYPMREQRVCP